MRLPHISAYVDKNHPVKVKVTVKIRKLMDACLVHSRISASSGNIVILTFIWPLFRGMSQMYDMMN